MQIHDDITVQLPYWAWVYFLGWARGFADDEDRTVQKVLAEIEVSVIP